MTNKNLAYWLAAMHANLPPIKMLNSIDQIGDIHLLYQTPIQRLKAYFSEPEIDAIKHPNWAAIEKDFAWATKPNHHLISFEDTAYPPLLKELAAPPYLLYVRGNLSALTSLQLAIVGSRQATAAGIKNAEQFARTLAEAGFAITSGLAAGIDTASHRGALAAEGITIAVTGTGLAHIYPRTNRALVETILEKQGALVSEFPLSTLAYPFNFPRRNRIIAGLSVGTLVIEAAIKSGSLITARLAVEAGREVFAIPGSIHHPLTRGCHYLIRQGAKLVETAKDILDEFSTYSLKLPKLTQTKTKLSDTEQRLLNHINYEITPLDVIILRSRLTSSEVSAILLTLELKNYVNSVPGGYVRIEVQARK